MARHAKPCSRRQLSKRGTPWRLIAPWRRNIPNRRGWGHGVHATASLPLHSCLTLTTDVHGRVILQADVRVRSVQGTVICCRVCLSMPCRRRVPDKHSPHLLLATYTDMHSTPKGDTILVCRHCLRSSVAQLVSRIGLHILARPCLISIRSVTLSTG